MADEAAAPDAVAKKQARSQKRKKGGKDAERKEKAARLLRGPGVAVKKVMDKKLKGKLRHAERVYREAQAKAVKANEWLLPEDAGYLEAEGVERTWNAKQADIAAAVETGAAQKVIDLRLPQLGPYCLDFQRSGRHVVLGGRKGHLAMVDWQRKALVCEVQVREVVRDVTFLHNETMFAAAQKKYVYVYDKRGVEVHCMRDHTEPAALQFLPHHFLLASVGDAGILHYQDTSTGHIAASHKTRLGPCAVMRQNPWNAVLGLGHTGGVVTMWTPNITTPVVKMLCHRGAISALAFDLTGRYMVTAGVDSQVRVWDIRTFKPLHAYFAYSPATSLDISQRGLLAVGYGRKVQVWRDALSTKATSPYMSHSLPEGDHLSDFQFVPYEDVMGVGSSGGFSTMLVPGAGEPNFDSFVANPYASLRERREAEVAHLLDKLQPETIVLDPDTIGRVRKEPLEVQKEKQAEAEAANAARRAAQEVRAEARSKMKGKNRPSKRHRKKQTNIIEERKPGVKQRMREQEERKAKAKKGQSPAPEDVPRALERFYKK
uniref:BING4 C-terminal domain-containing protein n=1 Tax=Chlamydomonas leiostraca TaxID=1034604 RepID=A0A7S0WQI7_9CHLO|mmetsp:Transcript_2371/g.5958  ORF Transcript_2371/g.5958 Transcript_2371/m.5958 type:complete len:545 (+) Transcript_2371:175-1809(+)|eukprot:CAMPEP_0202858740 /NCGR_PEP_ID=MMETSP1391-20130828/1139_1 /ASSEMBLY_ACC=CAM_ASM_000867 /TAXON_ID=1034604 /ORGANISM="Chlamydomonas leiostraca, Strain SAG 11-49" /LENGTH=544 /DNA_ID=CAMNT_0049537691 /DNA_START=169 /DNA_END=1803 /DNA_ORIENTATION=+